MKTLLSKSLQVEFQEFRVKQFIVILRNNCLLESVLRKSRIIIYYELNILMKYSYS